MTLETLALPAPYIHGSAALQSPLLHLCSSSNSHESTPFAESAPDSPGPSSIALASPQARQQACHTRLPLGLPSSRPLERLRMRTNGSAAAARLCRVAVRSRRPPAPWRRRSRRRRPCRPRPPPARAAPRAAPPARPPPRAPGRPLMQPRPQTHRPPPSRPRRPPRSLAARAAAGAAPRRRAAPPRRRRAARPAARPRAQTPGSQAAPRRARRAPAPPARRAAAAPRHRRRPAGCRRRPGRRAHLPATCSTSRSAARPAAPAHPRCQARARGAPAEAAATRQGLGRLAGGPAALRPCLASRPC